MPSRLDTFGDFLGETGLRLSRHDKLYLTSANNLGARHSRTTPFCPSPIPRPDGSRPRHAVPCSIPGEGSVSGARWLGLLSPICLVGVWRLLGPSQRSLDARATLPALPLAVPARRPSAPASTSTSTWVRVWSRVQTRYKPGLPIPARWTRIAADSDHVVTLLDHKNICPPGMAHELMLYSLKGVCLASWAGQRATL